MTDKDRHAEETDYSFDHFKPHYAIITIVQMLLHYADVHHEVHKSFLYWYFGHCKIDLVPFVTL